MKSVSLAGSLSLYEERGYDKSSSSVFNFDASFQTKTSGGSQMVISIWHARPGAKQRRQSVAESEEGSYLVLENVKRAI